MNLWKFGLKATREGLRLTGADQGFVFLCLHGLVVFSPWPKHISSFLCCRTSRELTPAEEELFKDVTSQDKLQDFVDKQEEKKVAGSLEEDKRSQRLEMRKNKDGTETVVKTTNWTGGRGGDDSISAETEGDKVRVSSSAQGEDAKGMTVNTNPNTPGISGSQLDEKTVRLLLRQAGFTEDEIKKVKVDKDGVVTHADMGKIGKLPGVNEKDPGSKSVGSFLQTMLYMKSRKESASHEDAMKARIGPNSNIQARAMLC